MGDERDIPITRAVGRFFGHIVQSVKRPAPQQEREEIARESSERTGEIDGKKVVLRRTTVDEIEYKDG